MKTIIIAAALGTLIATPVLAQTSGHPTKSAARAHAQQAPHLNPNYTVYVGGKFIGADPDAHVRSQLMNDPEQGGNGSGGGD
jgi:hypothetical protein